MRRADRVRDLDLAALGQAGGHDVLGDPAHGVGAGAVDLRRVLAGERAAAVAGHAAVGVDDDLAPGQAGIPDGAPDHEPPGRVDEEVLRRVELALVVELRRQHGMHHVLPQVGADQRVAVDAVPVLGGDQDLVDLDRPAVLVANRDLRLPVRPQVGDHVRPAHLGEAVGELVRERDGERHELGRLARRVAEHHPLVAGARDVELVVVGRVGARLQRLVDALGDVRRLLVDRVDDRAGVAREAEVGVRVADLADRLPGNVLDVDVGRGRDLSRHDDQPGVHERLAGHAPGGVVAQDGVEDAVGDLVGDLVGVSLGHRLRGEQEFVVGRLGHEICSTSSVVDSAVPPDEEAPSARMRRRSLRAAR